MCYVYPGPRCSHHAELKLLLRSAPYKAEPFSDENKKLRNEAILAFSVTPKGISQTRHSGKIGADMIADISEVRRNQMIKEMLIKNPKTVILPEDEKALTPSQIASNKNLAASYKELLTEAEAERDATGMTQEEYDLNRKFVNDLSPEEKKTTQAFGRASLKIRELNRTLALEDNEADAEKAENARVEAEKAQAAAAEDEEEAPSYDAEGYDFYGFDKDGYNKKGKTENGFDRKQAFNRIIKGEEKPDKYDYLGLDVDGNNRKGFSMEGIHKVTGTKFNTVGRDSRGFDKDGWSIDKNTGKAKILRSGRTDFTRDEIEAKVRAAFGKTPNEDKITRMTNNFYRTQQLA